MQYLLNFQFNIVQIKIIIININFITGKLVDLINLIKIQAQIRTSLIQLKINRIDKYRSDVLQVFGSWVFGSAVLLSGEDFPD